VTAWREGRGRYNGRGPTPCYVCGQSIVPPAHIYRRRLPDDAYPKKWELAHDACAATETAVPKTMYIAYVDGDAISASESRERAERDAIITARNRKRDDGLSHPYRIVTVHPESETP
jgi:hypothetical protein